MSKRKLEVDIIVDDKHASGAFRNIGREADTLGSRMSTLGAAGARALSYGIGAAAVGAVYGIKKSVDAAREANKVAEQTTAVIKSTGAAAHVSAAQVEGLSGAISRKAGIDDEAIQSGANLVLTFKNIRNEAGEGNKVFNQTVGLATDMSVALGQDVTASAMTLGKALNDPAEGLSRLTRVGVTFTEQQQEQIKALDESGHRLAAQKMILREVRSEFGGSAAAQADSFDKLGVAAENIEESIGNVFIPIFSKAADTIRRDFLPDVQAAADQLDTIWGKDGLTLETKLRLSREKLSPIVADLREELKDSHIGDTLSDVIEDAIPVVASHAGKMGIEVAKGLVHGFATSDVLGKAAIAGVVLTKLGGLGALGGIGGLGGAGTKIGKSWGVALSPGIARGLRFGLAGALAGGLGAVMGSEGGSPESGALTGAAAGAIAGPWGAAIGGAIGTIAANAFGPSFEDQMLKSGLDDFDKRFGAKIGTALQVKDLSSLDRARERLLGIKHELMEIHKTPSAGGFGGLSEDSEQVREVERRLHELNAQVNEFVRTPRRAAREGFHDLRSGFIVTLDDIAKVSREGISHINAGWVKGTDEWREQVVRGMNAQVDAIRAGMRSGVIETDKGQDRIRSLIRNAHLVSGDDPWGIAAGFTSSWGKAGKVNDKQIDNMIKDLRKMPPAAREAAEDAMVAQAQALVNKGKLSERALDRLRSRLVSEWGLTSKQSTARVRAGATAILGVFGDLSDSVGGVLGVLEDNVNSALKAFGVQKEIDYSAKRVGNATLGSLQGVLGALGNTAGDLIDGRARGGEVNRPMIIAGEEAPLHNEWMIATNPAYRQDNIGYWVQAGHDLGIPGFAQGGQLPQYRVTGPEPMRSAGQRGVDYTTAVALKYLSKYGRRTLSSVKKEANRMDALQQPYLWGGGHGPMPSKMGPWDCSGAVSELLYGAGFTDLRPMVSGGFESWGLPGKGDVSILANAEHVYAVIGGRAWGTSGENPGGGAGWISGYTYRPGFVTRHAPLMGAIGTPGRGRGKNKGQGQKPGYAEGGLVAGVGSILLRNGLDAEAAAGILGNAYGESSWNTASTDGAGNGGLWGFTASPVSLSEMQAYAESQNLPWTSAKAQTQFMLHHLSGGLKSKLNAADSTDDTTSIFMHEWERPASYASLGTRQAAASRALSIIKGLDGGGASGGKKKPPKHGVGQISYPGQWAGGIGKDKDPTDNVNSSIGVPHLTPPLAVDQDNQPGIGTPGSPVLLGGLGATALPPEAAGLPVFYQNLLKSPGLTLSGQLGIIGQAIDAAGNTEDSADDITAYRARIALDKIRRNRLRKKLKELNKALGKAATPAARARILNQRNTVMEALGETVSEIAGDYGSIQELNTQTEDDGTSDLKAAIEESTQATNDLKDAILAQNAIAGSELAVGLAEARRALADMISGELGPRADHQAQTAGIGTVGSL